MKRRLFLMGSLALVTIPIAIVRTANSESTPTNITRKLIKSDKEWRRILTADQFYILREEGTERAFSSSLNGEKRKGIYVCAGCDTAVFNSDMKFDSGTGWPSFYTHLPNAFETKLDFKLIYPRKEYHCATCGGHHGHVFKDGPEPTGERWCNNGLALKFIPA